MLVHQYLAATLSPRAVRERGASVVEYSLLVALIAVVCISAITYLGGETAQSYSQIGTSLN